MGSWFLVRELNASNYCRENNNTLETLYSQRSPCGHVAITDTPLIRTAAKSPAKITVIWLKQTPANTNTRYYGLTDTFLGPDGTSLLL